MSSSNPSRLTAAALVVFALCFVYEQLVIVGALIPPLLVFAVVSLLIAGAVVWGWRWAPLLGAAWILLVFLSSISVIVSDLANPAAFHQFLWQVVTLAVAVVGVVAGIGATMRNYRRTSRTVR